MTSRAWTTIVFSAAFLLTTLLQYPAANAAWIGTGAATGTITSMGTNDLQDLYFTTVTLSTTIPNCTGSPTSAVIPYRQPNGTQLTSYQTMLNIALSAKLSGTQVNIWADTTTYTVFGNQVQVCTIHQLEIRP
jgi:hypothetical protein